MLPVMVAEPVRFLTPEWGAALEAAANASEEFRRAVEAVTLTILQEITPDGDDEGGDDGGGGEGSVRYALAFGGGRLEVRWGEREGDVTFAQTRDTAERISRGDLNAQQAFVLGKLRVRGDLERLLSARDAFARLGDAFSDLRARTTY